MKRNKNIVTIDDYINDETRVSAADRMLIEFEVELIGKMIEAREKKGLTQKKLAEMSGLKQPAIARLENMTVTPQINTLFRVLHSLGYTIEIVPLPDAPAVSSTAISSNLARV